MLEDRTITAVRRVLAENPKKALDGSSLEPAGVLLLLYPRDGEYRVLLNRRTDTVEDHKGEIAFPGGRMEKSDRTLLETALRETQEEMGIDPEQVEVLGELDDEVTISNYVISPYVGTIPPSSRFKPNDREVAEVLEVPVGSLADEGSVRYEAKIAQGGVQESRSYVYRGELIWGATARVLDRFLGLLEGLSPEEAPWKRGQR